MLMQQPDERVEGVVVVTVSLKTDYECGHLFFVHLRDPHPH